MRRDEDGRPVVGDRADCLGVRTSGRHADVAPDGHGQVHPGRGMSVAPELRLLPSYRLDASYRDRGHPQADGDCQAWTMGTAEFVAGAVTERLWLRPDQQRGSVVQHGVVEPAQPMPLAAYREALAGTRADWQEV